MYHGSVSPEIAKGLKVLQERIAKRPISSSKLDESFNLATWNIRAFGETRRTPAAIHYIAEILGQFDLISIVELREDLRDLRDVLAILGPYWRAVYSDVILDAGGNRERIAFVYDKRALTFNGFVAEANPSRRKRGDVYIPDFEWWRAPYMASFRSGDFDFVILTVHIQWGTESGRLEELVSLAEWIDAKRKREFAEDVDWMVTGDFNITTDAMMQALQSKGLQMPKALRDQSIGTDLAKANWYDRILHLPIYPENFANIGGYLDFFDGDFGPLFPGMEKEKCTYQLSDHLPLWVQINTDIDGRRLDQIIRG